ncbi:EmrB/QacA family drug resistance transporter [Calothrix sp. NIES-4071]|nr:EmrB/QacA family drug resistance transporter [Calothrix sp. NIES-4071]BAZ55240.1 EmrB/QacA family drug resistance transporter [Calothrix sp. NIES-4105]
MKFHSQIPSRAWGIDQLTQMFLQHTSDPVQAQNQAYAFLDRTIRREANVMAFNDCFFFMGCALGASVLLVLLLKKVKHYRD